MEPLSERLVNKMSAIAVFRKKSLKDLEKVQESLTFVMEEKRVAEAEENSKRAKQSTAVHAAMKLLADVGLALDQSMLSDDVKKVKKVIAKEKKEVKKRAYPSDQKKYKITDKSGNTRFWSGCGHPPPQFTQVFNTAKPKPRKEMLLAVLDYKYVQVFDNLTKCVKE